MKIRPAILADATAIAQIYNHYVLNSTASFETKPLSSADMRLRLSRIIGSFPALIADNSDGTITGFCYAHLWKERPAYKLTWENTVYVDHNSIGRGIGVKLMLALIEECRKTPCRTLIACITGDNTASIRMHQRLGFRKVSEFRNVGFKFGRFLDVVDLQYEFNSQQP